MRFSFARFQKRPSPLLFSTTDVLIVPSRDCPLRRLAVISHVSLAGSLVPEQLLTVQATGYRMVTSLSLFGLSLPETTTVTLQRAYAIALMWVRHLFKSDRGVFSDRRFTIQS